MQTIQEPKKKLFILQENAAKQKIGDYVIGSFHFTLIFLITNFSLFKRTEKTVGQGTFGKVKLGTHVLTGEKVILND
jgi:hypothetical protein